MISLANKVGRLFEMRCTPPLEERHVIEFELEIGRLLRAGHKILFCSDLRHSPIVSPEIADRFGGLLRRDVPLLERSAVLIPSDQAILNMQVQRIVREAGTPARQVFKDPAKLVEWLGELCTDDERARLEAFVNEMP